MLRILSKSAIVKSLPATGGTLFFVNLRMRNAFLDKVWLNQVKMIFRLKVIEKKCRRHICPPLPCEKRL